MQTVQQFMQRCPHTIAPSETLATAHQVMRQACIRHLPVVAGEALVGVVSLHDLHLLETLDGVDPCEATVEEAMTVNLYAVAPQTPVAEVALGMADRCIGSALVVDEGRLVGILTSYNALRVLARKPAVAVIEDPAVDGSAWLPSGEIEIWPRRPRERRV